VLSDMAASATGDTQTDHLRIIALAETAHDFARQVLKEGGTFVAKVLRGGTERSPARPPEARLRKSPPRQAGSQSRRLGGNVCRRHGLSRLRRDRERSASS